MSRYIDIDKAIPIAIQAVVDIVGHGISQIDAVNIADKFEEVSTADVVEVVRCKDCVFADCLPSGLFRCRKHSVYSMFRNSILNTNPDDYCSFGERSENGK